MDIVKSENFSHGGMPTVFEDRTLFPPPVIDATFEPKRSSPLVPLLIFGFMLLPVLGLGYLALQSNSQVTELTKKLDDIDLEAQAKALGGLQAKIDTLTAERDALKVEVATVASSQDLFKDNIAKLINQSTALVTEIDKIRKEQRPNSPAIPTNLRTIPPTWDDAAIDILQKHVDALNAHKVKVIGVQPLARPVTEGTVSGGGDRPPQ